jgi:hypothetical protein
MAVVLPDGLVGHISGNLGNHVVVDRSEGVFRVSIRGRNDLWDNRLLDDMITSGLITHKEIGLVKGDLEWLSGGEPSLVDGVLVVCDEQLVQVGILGAHMELNVRGLDLLVELELLVLPVGLHHVFKGIEDGLPLSRGANSDSCGRKGEFHLLFGGKI